ncbi:MAG TPA: response regulator [Stellaceae bacterium]|nr:response regulator [Stellaceae bacterium]
MSDNGHILVVDDEVEVCNLIRNYLSGEGFEVSVAHNGDDMRETLERSAIDLVILDLVLPGEDGLALARSLRDVSAIPILMLTGRGDPVDRIVGLEMGADDYLAKPFHLRELRARVQSVLRRVSGAMQAETSDGTRPPRPRARFAGWTFDLSTRELLSPSGEDVRLTPGEFDLLVAFVTNAGQTLSRDRLLDLIRDRDADAFDRTIDVRVGRLRRKLGDDPHSPQLIRTVRGGGYLFSPPVAFS